MWTKFVIALAVVLCVALESGALELVSNGNFDSDLTPWSGASSSQDAGRDADGFPNSGSAELSNTSGAMFGAEFLSQCIDGASAGTEYFFGAQLRFRELEVSGGQANVIASALPLAGCFGSTLGSGGTPLVATSAGRGIWLSAALGDTSGGGFVAPVGTQSLRLSVRLIKDQPGGSLTANFDRVYLAPVGTPVCGGLPATMVGTGGKNVLQGTPGRDVIVGLAGNDTLDGMAGNDILCGGGGKDKLLGRGGFDLLKGGAGDDVLRGGTGDDVLRGQGGDDKLFGGGGDDVLAGNGGTDGCDGGAGAGDVASSCETVTAVP